MGATDLETDYVDHPLLEPAVVENRRYQRRLADAAKRGHTLVCLPTGLGKTTVSLLVTADRLHDDAGGRALLLAPTKPLVEQHAAFYRMALTIPDDEIVVFTGEVRPDDRGDLWADARVVVATPQVVQNDLVGSRIELRDVVHLTFDECHRGTGDYAYTYIAERYHADAADPLVTGMSASPGGDEEEILQVCENLGIERVEVMTEADADVDDYTYDTSVDWERIDLPEDVEAIRDRLAAVVSERLERLKELGVASSTDPNMSEHEVQKMGAKLRELMDAGKSKGYEGMSLHAEIRKLRTALTYVETQSVESLRRYLQRLENSADSSGASKADKRLVADPKVQEATRLAESYDGLHPKFSRARMLVARTLGIEDGERVIVFTESRDTAETLTAFLGEHFDTRRFVGQGDREGSDGMTQTAQQETLEAFRDGEFEVLVSTSVAEEGLDVPEVDLVLFYEPVPTAIRSIQRKGRTGRQTEGAVVVLMAEGTRDEAYYWKSRQEEKRMESELRSLKGVAGDLTELLGSEQRDLAAYEGDENADAGDEGGDAGEGADGDAGSDADADEDAKSAPDAIADAAADASGGDEAVDAAAGGASPGQAGLTDFGGAGDPEGGSDAAADAGGEDGAGAEADPSDGENAGVEATDGADTDADAADDADDATDEEAVAAVASPPDEGVEVVVDQRELDSAIAKDLSKREAVEVRLETLAVGDYVLSDRVTVERKTVADFLDSLLGGDRSVFEQVGDAARHYDRPVVVVEGEGDLYEERNVHPNAIRGALASLAVDYGVSVLRTRDEADTADLLEVIAGREQETADREVSVHGGKAQKTLAEQQEYVVSAIADIGPVTARSLLDEFGSVEAVMTASEDELMETHGVGEVTASRIREVVGTEYDG